MGQKSSTDTTGAIFIAFLDRATWKQSDLARRIGVSPKVLKAHLESLARIDARIEREEDDGVWWSVPRGWFPEAVALPRDTAVELVRLLSRSPKSASRDRILKLVLGAAPERGSGSGNVDAVASGLLQAEERHLDLVEDSASRQRALSLRYFSASRGDLAWRDVSVQRVHAGEKPRFVALCHRDAELKWFRVDAIQDARENQAARYIAAEPEALKAFEAASVAGLHEGSPPRKLVFRVGNPEARWVRNNLLDGMVAESRPDGLRVSIETSAPRSVARFVVGLGESAHPETPELARLVAELASGALQNAKDELNGRTVAQLGRPNRANTRGGVGE
jgi:proteasome accessory factor C